MLLLSPADLGIVVAPGPLLPCSSGAGGGCRGCWTLLGTAEVPNTGLWPGTGPRRVAAAESWQLGPLPVCPGEQLPLPAVMCGVKAGW